MEKNILKENQFFKKLNFLNLIIIAITSGIIFLKNNYLPEKIPFFYSLPWGEEQLASKNWLWFLSAGLLFLFLLNYFISKFLQKKGEKFLSFSINCCSLLFSILGTITILQIIFLVT